jgi:hypothetical protein
MSHSILKSPTFIITTHINNQQHLAILMQGIGNITFYHPNSKIVIIDDYSFINILQALNYYFDIQKHDIKVELGMYQGGGEMLPYLHYYKNKYDDKCIIIHDSFHIQKDIGCIQEINDIKFVWYATNNKLQWHTIVEPDTVYNKQHNIVTHDDAIKHFFNRNIDKWTPEFVSYFNMIYDKKEWIVCFGIMSIINYDFLVLLQDKTHILDIVSDIKNRRERMVMESLFSIACEFTLNHLPESYDGLYFNGIGYGRVETETFKKIFLNR